jgi:hypothetical protein
VVDVVPVAGGELALARSYGRAAPGATREAVAEGEVARDLGVSGRVDVEVDVARGRRYMRWPASRTRIA